MSKSQANIQDAFLNQARRDNVLVTVYLVNGVQIKGQIKGFDSFTVILHSEGRQLLIYKHALSTIAPSVSLGNLTAHPDEQSR